MTVVSASLGILLFGVAGYIAEPYLRQRTAEATGNLPRNVQTEQSAEDAPLDLNSWRDDQLPSKVQLKRDVEVRASNSDVPMIVPAGARVTLIRRSQDQLIISSAPGLEGSVAAADTDLFRQLRNQPVVQTPAPAPKPVEEPAPEPAVAAANEPTATAPPAAEPVPAPTEPPVQTDPIPATAVTLDESQIVSTMQASINAQQIKKFGYSAVTSWKASETENIDGQSYQTGLVTYKDQTIFGVKNIQAKALILNGKVQRWIWPTSGLEIP